MFIAHISIFHFLVEAYNMSGHTITCPDSKASRHAIQSPKLPQNPYGNIVVHGMCILTSLVEHAPCAKTARFSAWNGGNLIPWADVGPAKERFDLARWKGALDGLVHGAWPGRPASNAGDR